MRARPVRRRSGARDPPAREWREPEQCHDGRPPPAGEGDRKVASGTPAFAPLDHRLDYLRRPRQTARLRYRAPGGRDGYHDDDIGDAAASLSVVLAMPNGEFRIDLVVFRRDSVAVFAASMHQEGQEPGFSAEESARLLDERILDMLAG